ncbi:MAG: hypothetical protein A2020_05470 [Lentisphaerae bacterium GWF2_45_14]|nr:MAG: hypothetical protein A2020_05470 [Lentisphaerae bacterium GWF2_45_14]
MKKFIFSTIIMSTLSIFAVESINLPILKDVPAIDGKFSDSEWAKASCASGFIRTGGEWPRVQTSVYLGVDDENLYFAFKCMTGKRFDVLSKKRKDDSTGIFGDESVEFFISPSGKEGESYYHIGINPSNSLYSASCGKARDTSWSPEIKTVCGVSEEYWFAEGRIALASVNLKAVEGKSFFANFGRNVCSPEMKGSSSWTGQADFNDPRLFGKLMIAKFAGFDYSLEDMSKIVLRNNGPSALNVLYSLGEEKKSVDVLAFTALPVNIRLPEKEMRELTLEISSDGKSFVKKGDLPYVKKLSLVPELFYSPKSAEKIKSSISSIYDNIDRLEIVADSFPFHKTFNVNEFEIDLKEANPGRSVFTLKAFDRNNKLLGEDRAVIYIMEDIPASALPEKQEISLDGNVFMMNGKPFFPFMASDTKDPSQLVADSFNVRFGPHGVRNNAMERGSCGLGTRIDRTRGVVYEIADDEVVKENIKKTVVSLVFYRQLQYEIQISLRRKSSDEMLNGSEKYLEYYEYVKKISPETLVSVQIDKMDKIREYTAAADIVEVASRQSSYAKNMIRNLAADIKYAKETVGNKPLVWWLGASIPNPYVRDAESLRAASYISMMHGANGIIYHMGHGGIPLSMTRLWSLFRGLSREMEFLYPIVISGKAVDMPTVKFNCSEIDFICREFEGDIYIIAVNTSGMVLEPVISINGAVKVSVLFENREIKSEDGRFKDLFTSYEPHVYRFTKRH